MLDIFHMNSRLIIYIITTWPLLCKVSTITLFYKWDLKLKEVKWLA